MSTLITSLKMLLAVAAVLAFRPAQAQNNPVASASVMASLTPVTNLNAPPAPEEDAHFYDDTCKDLGHSLAWIEEANAVQPKYWNLYTEARIHLRMKNYPAAKAAAVRARQLAQAAANPAYMQVSEEVIKLADAAPASLAANSTLASAK